MPRPSRAASPQISVSRDLRPTEGVRFLLEREQESHTRATYRAAIFTPTSTFSTTATLGDDGSVELLPAGAPVELEERLAIIVKLLARDAAKRRADGLIIWPARILRWRK